MTTLIDFIEARLAEDEQIARNASMPLIGGDRETWVYDRDAFAVRATHGRWSVATRRDDPSDSYLITIGDAYGEHITANQPARVLREVAAKRAILARESIVELPDWKPDCGGDWVLSGTGFFANYWPDNTVTASITDGFDGPTLADSGIVPRESRAACQLFAEEWIRQHLPERSPILRALAAVWSDHPDYREEWAA